MSSLSTGKLQIATRKVVASAFVNSPSLRGQFHEVDEIIKILAWKCGVAIDNDTLSKAFTSKERFYSLALKHMNVGHDGDDILYVYKSFCSRFWTKKMW